MTELEIAVAIAVIVLVIFSPILWRRRNLRLSKDDAEVFVRRRFPHGTMIGARFTKSYDQHVWEFDILDTGRIHRIQISARNGMIMNNWQLPARGSYGVMRRRKVA